jgi:hypothetical protein
MKNVFNITDLDAVFSFEGTVTKHEPAAGYSMLSVLCSMALNRSPHGN